MIHYCGMKKIITMVNCIQLPSQWQIRSLTPFNANMADILLQKCVMKMRRGRQKEAKHAP